MKIENLKLVSERFLKMYIQFRYAAPVRGSKFAAAVNYALNRRDLMMTYFEDGRCSLSNNLSEQKMKSFVTAAKAGCSVTPRRVQKQVR